MLKVKRQILIIDDNDIFCDSVTDLLADDQTDVLTAHTGRDGLKICSERKIDVVILDQKLPDTQGVNLCPSILKHNEQTKIIFVTAYPSFKNAIDAIKVGAHDYLSKPFGMGELLARIRVSLRNRARLPAWDGAPTAASFRVGDLKVDFEARRVFLGEEEVHLTPIEYKLMTVMARNAGKVLTHNYLLREVWGPGSGDQNHYVRIYMAGLRRKLERDQTRPRYIFTEVGVGYRLADE